MTAIPLTSGAYSGESYIANAQRAVNVYVERNPEETHPTFPTTHFVKPGNLLLNNPPQPGQGRCLYRATNGDLYAVINQTVYYIDPNWQFNAMATPIVLNATTPVYMADNAKDILVVDGSPQGYDINMAARAMTQIGDPNFPPTGIDRVDYLDTFLIFNISGTNQWGCTLSDQIVFNGLFIGQKEAWPDNVLAVIAVERQAFIMGSLKSEPWFNAGQVPFPFQLTPGVIIEQAMAGKYALGKMDAFLYWLSQAPEGARMAMRCTSNNVAQRISTHAIEREWLRYARVDDCIVSTLQIKGHSFVSYHFPTADRTWVYDQATEQWWEDAYYDQNGVQHRSRNTFTAYAYGKNVALDWSTGSLYQVDPDTLTDNGSPIPWIRSFPHFVNELKYVNLASITADVETGTRPGQGDQAQFTSPWSNGFNSGFGPRLQVAKPTVSLRLSRDGGATYGNNRLLGRVASGNYRSMMRWRGNGVARDWVIEFSSTAEMSGALNGAYIDPIGAAA